MTYSEMTDLEVRLVVRGETVGLVPAVSSVPRRTGPTVVLEYTAGRGRRPWQLYALRALRAADRRLQEWLLTRQLPVHLLLRVVSAG